MINSQVGDNDIPTECSALHIVVELAKKREYMKLNFMGDRLTPGIIDLIGVFIRD